MIEPHIVICPLISGSSDSSTCMPVVPPVTTTVPPRATEARGVVPRGRTDAVDDRPNLARQRLVRIEGAMRAEPFRQRAAHRVATGRPDFKTCGTPELDQRGGHTARRALHEQGFPRLKFRLGE